jgi:hypothetical protein
MIWVKPLPIAAHMPTAPNDWPGFQCSAKAIITGSNAAPRTRRTWIAKSIVVGTVPQE